MYLIGAPHPHKAEAQVLMERLIAAGERMVTDAEVLQEVLHRYTVSARDAIHIAAMERHSVRSIFTFDADFDRWSGLKRLHGTVS